jgi:Dyp-type peroxidase family
MSPAMPLKKHPAHETTEETLELDDIQGTALQPLPTPYVGRFSLLRFDDRRLGRKFLKLLTPLLRTVANPTRDDVGAGISVALSFQGLRALGVPDSSLGSFSKEFREGMAARASRLHDVAESAPEHWETPFGSSDVHAVVTAMARDQDRLNVVLQRAAKAHAELGGVTPIYHQDCKSAEGYEAFGFKANISQPAIEGSGIPSSNPKELPLKAGEFILGYLDETGRMAPMPAPEVLGKNGSYLVIRKFQQRVAAFRRYLRENAASPAEEELVAAKIMGRWRSGAPLALTPDRDDPALGADPDHNNDFGYITQDDARGFKCPFGSHVRRMNPRDSEIFGNPRRHRLVRREVSYGPPLAEGVLEDDGIDRGMIFACVVASINQQFEFVQEEWANSGVFIGQGNEKDPLCGANEGTGTFTIPQRPIRRRLEGLPSFVVVRGGDYFFLPGLKGLHWLADLST